METIKVDRVTFDIGDIGIIDKITFSARKNDFVSIIGPSGCGKSTLLRIMAGLIPPAKGRVMYRDRQIREPVREITFVFQDFGLLPWLTNVENVKLGLSYVEMTEDEKAYKANERLNKMGLHGFENSYPNVLSGGMKQRVGIARATVSDPKIILMDEPFSALDELTADILRSDILYMLKSTDIPVETVIMVTHNVEEAVEMSDKIIVLSNKPSHLKGVIDVGLEYPRNRKSRAFQKAVDGVYKVLTE
ncbi:MAG: ABC transporter ATP-binding protein [Candidatus Micrarchaeaceae archaeon]